MQAQSLQGGRQGVNPHEGALRMLLSAVIAQLQASELPAIFERTQGNLHTARADGDEQARSVGHDRNQPLQITLPLNDNSAVPRVVLESVIPSFGDKTQWKEACHAKFCCKLLQDCLQQVLRQEVPITAR